VREEVFQGIEVTLIDGEDAVPQPDGLVAVALAGRLLGPERVVDRVVIELGLLLIEPAAR